VLGQDHATVLMEHLPPVGWGDVATKRDLDHLKQELLATFRAELNTQTRAMITAMVWANSISVLTVAGLAFAAARLV
jgi:hypothetical protein